MSVFVLAVLSGALFCTRPLFPNPLSVSQCMCPPFQCRLWQNFGGVKQLSYVAFFTHKKLCEIQPLDHQDFREEKHYFSPAHKKFCEILPLFQISIHLSSEVWTPDHFLGALVGLARKGSQTHLCVFIAVPAGGFGCNGLASRLPIRKGGGMLKVQGMKVG